MKIQCLVKRRITFHLIQFLKNMKIKEFSPKSLMSPYSWAGHLSFAYWLMEQLSPDVFVELGTHTGNSYFTFCQSVKENALFTKCYAVDTWQGDDHAGEYSSEVYDYVSRHNDEHYKNFSNLMKMTFDDALNYFEDESIQLLHIDGLHTYDAVKNDFETWLPKLKKDGIILFHDTMVRERNFGVWKLWAELRKKYKDSFEFQHSHGLGVLRLGGNGNRDLDEFFAHVDEQSKKNIFSGLSSLPILEKINKEKDSQIILLTNSIKENEKFIENLKVEVIRSENQIKTEADRQVQIYKNKSIQLSNELDTIQNSRSWRYTKQIRKIGAKIRYYKNLTKNWLKIIAQSGGPKVVVSKTIKFINREGVSGLLRRNMNSPKLIGEKKFDASWYLEINKELADAGIEPYLHYSKHGFFEGRFARRLGEKILRIDSPTQDLIQQFTRLQSKWARQPKITVVMPVYNTREKWLREAIDSVLSQIYENWELCICDDTSTHPHVKAVLEHYRNLDPRVRVVYNTSNGGVSTASNQALKMAVGDYIALMDHDDILEPHALHFIAKAIIEKSPDIIYSDEVIMDENCSKMIGHACRPSFSLELLRSHPYIVHLVAYRRTLLQRIGGFNEELSISQDYDLLLRASEKSRNIVHVAEVLYKWRTHENSAGHEKKKKVMDVSKDLIKQHLHRSGYSDFQVEDGVMFNFFKVRYKLNPSNKVAIIIPTKDRAELVRQCIESIEKTTESHLYDIVVVDHASSEADAIEYFKKLCQLHTVMRCEGEFNFSHINNWAINNLKSQYSHYLLLNNDVEAIQTGWLERMLELGQQSDIGIVGAKLYYPDGKTIQHAGVCVGMYGAAEHYGKFMEKNFIDTADIQPGYLGSLIATREMSAVTAACMLIRSDVFHQVHGLDEHAKVGFGDIDFCLRVLAAGYRVIFCAEAELIHHESLSRGKSEADPHPEDTDYFLQRWQAFIEFGDPYYNPNLSLTNTHWGLKLKIDSEKKKIISIRSNLTNS